MTAFNFRSLLLAAIVLSNCITWTASRHHYAHNVHQRRTRHRRQGAGLYLPASYVIPGGEGEGPWGEWGEVSPCSRTCGGGVASQKRICLQPGPEGQCSGGDTKYFSCQTQDCPDGSGDFRAEQCAEFNDEAFRGFKYNWVPYTKAPNPCELNCMPHGERFYFRHKLQVTDGTRCNDESFDVCVNGQCQPVGCDMMLNSTAREDKCRECRGNGANCRTSAGIFDSQDLVKGYNDILLIPAGSTSIYIKEVEPSNNYLALRAKNGTYYLNGHYHIDFPRTIMIAGALWTYERSQQGFAAPDKLRCLGPTTEPLYLSLLLQDTNVGIEYEYSVPNNLAPPTDKQYNWVHEEFTPCSATCGGGFQTRNVTCRSREELEIVDVSLCDEGLRPPTNQSCSPDPCPAQWVEGPWGECSQRCGSGGVKSREVTCQKIIANGIKSVVPDKECFDLLGPKPEVFQKCNEDAPCPTWFVGHWKPCDQLCDEGKQTRQVVCHQKKNNRIEVLGDGNCTEVKPEEEQSCMLQPCDGVDWVTSSWSGCDYCTSKNRTRLVLCSTKGGQVLNDSVCSYHNRPADFEECKEKELPACEVQWYATQWSKCSVNCGDGVQTRKVFCGMYYDDKSGEGVEVIEDSKCANLTKYKDTKPCTVPKEECPSQWFAGPWEKCTEICDGGVQYRNVMCYRGDKVATDCDPNIVLDSTQSCNTASCNPDHLMPVSRTSTVIMDDIEEDCEDEVYEEVGLDFTFDTMMSDSPGYAEHESTLETGSGYGSSLSTDDLTTEGSGFSTMDTTDSSYMTDDDTGSGETSLTPDLLSSTASKDKDATTRTTVIPSTKIPTETSKIIESSAEETGSTPTSLTKDTEATSSSDSTGSTESTAVEKTESTPTVDTGSTSSDTSSTSLEETTETEASGPTTVEETESIESNITKKIASTSETGSSDTDDTGSTTVAETGSTESSLSTDDKEIGSTSETGSISSGETTSTDMSGTGSTDTEKTENTDSSGSTDAKETVSTSKTVSNSSGETTLTSEMGSTDTNDTESTVSGSTDEIGSTNLTVTETTGPTETTITKESSSTESIVTEVTSPTESTITEVTGSTKLTVTENTGSTESTVTEETGSTESTVGDTTESTFTSDTDSIRSESTNTGSTDTEETSSTGAEDIKITGDTDSTTTTRAIPTGSTTTTLAVPTESREAEPTTPSSTDSKSTVETSTSSGVDSSTGLELTSEAAKSSPSSGSDGTTNSGSTISTESTTKGAESSSLGAGSSTPSETESTTAATESSSSASESTGAESSTSSGTESTAEFMESGSTVSSESSTESGSSTETSSTVSGEITTGTGSTEESTSGSGSTPESTGSEESSISTYSTTEGTTIEGSTEESGSKATELSTTEETTSTTIWTKSTVFVPAKKVCKPRRKLNCRKTKFGCCPDQKSPATGPFDDGCPKPHTCKDSIHGCCPDGLSPAQGKNNEGCPVEPCADTLFGCCASDNTTAAQGNDQDGCPPPPPPCASSKYGCCADNDTEATGPEKEGCPETETSTTGALTDTTTETTESIETSEGSTTNEGTTDVIGTTTLDPCSSFEFGCCADNETEASGPNGQGCPCNATEFGCCPDGVSPASGLENEGCPGPCSTSPHGCCQDDKTPAHGPDFEGCCLLQAFGCCPDNRKPAEGPHLDGCGCQYALHGCCPDNFTIARGADNQGCGCQYTQHGCCPDRHTAASGPNNEGCACNTYQFGCCADGVTTAKGPEQQGCHCRDSKFGCCGDGETHATGPDAAGCDCSSSRYGCCPDGLTEATGPKFLGCTDAPENKQAACSMSTDAGPCHNFTAMWYYDLAYGGCSRFWYGGCEGNGNRFATKEDCEDVCVQPSPKDACKLPSVKGACDADYQRWHYNSTREQCIPFRYGGCLGNANNFDTRELCQKQCEPSSVAGQCNLPIDQGSCSGNYSRWGFNAEAHRCEQFIWGGCEGNSNRFSSEAACQMRCAGTQPLPDKCTLPAETGQCSTYRERWFYDTTFKRCRQFYYGGCGGNENNFGSEAECDNSCSEIKTTTTAIITTTTTTARPSEPQPQPRPAEPEQNLAAPERSEFCFNAIDAGPCNITETRYAYDSELGRCVTFQYGGCGGNQNNFPDEAYCSYYCQPMQDICQLPMLQGPCEDSLMRWFYDPTTDSCSQFTYGGCEGNDNRFESLEACETRCRTGPAPVEPTAPTTTVIADGPSECRVPEALEDCRYGGVVWYFDTSRKECVSHANNEAGPVCRYNGTFLSQEACERSCGAFREVDVCKQRMDPGPCRRFITKVYFDPSTGQCHEFNYGGCLGGANRFSSIEECSQVCKAETADPCTLPPERGNCFAYLQKWYYDPSRDQCTQFVYTGCSGNENRFETQSDCEARCKRPAPTTTTVATPPQQLAEPECKTPSSLAPCGNNVTVFYYDSERKQCLISGFGGCGHPNTYRTEEECERSCGAFRGIDVCGARLDPGPCRASINKIYWNAISGTCQPYAYGGCAGGPNRFSNVEECMSVCGDTGPDPNEVLIQDCTPYRQQCEMLADCQYGVERFTQDDGCERCQCREDPCVRANCQSNEHCVAVALRNSATQEPVYSARCVAETNEVYDCEKYVANCSRLRCEYGIQRTRLPDGCEKCSCVQVEIDCEPLRQECDRIKCNYGIERIIGTDGCERCKCKEYPCERKSCGAGERCVVQSNRNGIDPELMFTSECRTIVKAGACPMEETTTNEVTCRHECSDDADCRGVGKCCRRGCSDICLLPVEQTSPHPLLTTTVAPNVPAAPQALPQLEPEVSASEGGTATLRCLFHSNPPPKITWRFGELTIHDNVGRYRLMSDGALEIVSLYRNDTGVYICVADNGLGVATQEIHLAVNDPVSVPVGIAGDENAVVTGELGRPLYVRCLAYGYPPPSVFWYRGYDSVMVPYNDGVYQARGNVLLIRSLALETLGQYTCQAYNGEGKAASWVVFVRAYMPEGLFIENEMLVPRKTVAPRPRTQPPTTAETTTTTTSTTTEARPLFTVPVSTHVSTPIATLNIGADLRLTCEVDGFPEPEVHWTKDGVTVQMDDRITITGSAIVSRLTVTRLSVADSGLYTCHASNPYSSQSDTAQINVQQIIVPANCTDNPFFANCDLIVRGKYCIHKYYSTFCCKSCVESGQIDPQEAMLQADQPLRKK